MTLAVNIDIIKRKYANILKHMKDIYNNMGEDLIKVEDTRKGLKTILVTGGDEKKTYLHSKYDPVKEAETLINGYKERITKDTIVLFYGLGLGYHIESFIKEYSDIEFYIYEPRIDIINTYMANKNLEDIATDKLRGIHTTESINFLSNIVGVIEREILIIELPSHKNVFKSEYEHFSAKGIEILRSIRGNLSVNLKFQKRWIINSIKNFKYVLSTPNIVKERKGYFKRKTAIIVAAGPSLNEEIENIRYIKENELSYIFAVGSAVNTLISNSIYPHAVLTYDPGEVSHIVVKSIREKNISEIPVIYGTSVGYETLIDYPGCKLHAITSQDYISKHYLANEGMGSNPTPIISDTPTIAAFTIEVLYHLGFSRIIFAGQNLAYKDDKKYASGIDYYKDIELVKENELSSGIKVKDVYGNIILTNASFDNMRRQIEIYIKRFKNIEFINTTKGGADIKGSKFMELENVIENYITEKIVVKNGMICEITPYDKESIYKQYREMEREYRKTKEYVIDLNKNINSISRGVVNKNISKIDNEFIKLNETFNKIEHNLFFRVFLSQMNRVQYKMLRDKVDKLNKETDFIVKGEEIVRIYKDFFNSMILDMKFIEPLYIELKENINAYID